MGHTARRINLALVLLLQQALRPLLHNARLLVEVWQHLCKHRLRVGIICLMQVNWLQMAPACKQHLP